MSQYTHRTIIVPALGPLAAMARPGLAMVQAEAVE